MRPRSGSSDLSSWGVTLTSNGPVAWVGMRVSFWGDAVCAGNGAAKIRQKEVTVTVTAATCERTIFIVRCLSRMGGVVPSLTGLGSILSSLPRTYVLG